LLMFKGLAVERMHLHESGKLRAFFDIRVTAEVGFSIVVKGFKIMDGENGLWVAFPSVKKEDEYETTVFMHKDSKDILNQLGVDYYKECQLDSSLEEPKPSEKDDKKMVSEDLPF